jgi:hypothetical protein
MRTGRNEKPDLYAVVTCAKVRPDTKPLQRILHILCERFQFASGASRRRNPPVGGRLLLFLRSLLCHLLGGGLHCLLCFLRFLGHVVLYKKSLSDYAYAVHRHAQYGDDIRNAKLIPTIRSSAGDRSLSSIWSCRSPNISVWLPARPHTIQKPSRERKRLLDRPSIAFQASVAACHPHQGRHLLPPILRRERDRD